jgi:fucose permease
MAAIACVLLATVHPLAWVAYAAVGFAIGPIFPVTIVWLTRLLPRGSNATTGMLVGAMLGDAVLPASLGMLAGALGVLLIPVGIAAYGFAALGVVVLIHFRLVRAGCRPAVAVAGGVQLGGHRALDIPDVSVVVPWD